MQRILFLGRGSLSCWLLLLGSALVQAQERKIEIETRRDRSRPVIGAPRFSTIMGATVRLQDDVSAGKVEDIVLSRDGTCIDYLVVTENDKYVLVPWSAAKVDFGQRTVAVEIRKEKYRQVPTFTREAWPDLSDTKYTERIYNYYGVKPIGRERRIERRDDRKDRRDR
jgi:hypothetical protein